MGSHEHERLSAYLDDELDPAARAQVGAHLDACEECAARVAELAAVDGAVAALPSDAPQGYFETLPTRVRARLESRSAARRLPAWSWAVAAALLLAIVTPLTLQRSSRPAAMMPAPGVPLGATTKLSKEPASTQAEAPGALVPAPARLEQKTESYAQRPALAPKTRVSEFAAAPAESDAGVAARPAAPAMAQAGVPAPSVAAREEEATGVSASVPMAEAVVAPEARNRAQASGDRRAASSRDAVAAAAGDEAPLAGGRAGGAAAGALASPKLVEAEWRRLAAAQPRTPGEWRQVREEWRRFVARDPDGPQADAARVRTIEAGREAWRASSDPTDEALFRKDAADYLGRDDAVQKERVRGLLLGSLQ